MIRATVGTADVTLDCDEHRRIGSSTSQTYYFDDLLQAVLRVGTAIHISPEVANLLQDARKRYLREQGR